MKTRLLFVAIMAIASLFVSVPAFAKVISYKVTYKNGAVAPYVEYTATGSNFVAKGKADSHGRFTVNTGTILMRQLRVYVVSTYKNARGSKRTSLRGKKNPKLQKIRLSKPIPDDKDGPVITGVSPTAGEQVQTKKVSITVNVVDPKSGIAHVTAACGKDLGPPKITGSQYNWVADLGSETSNLRYKLVITAVNNRGIVTSTMTPFEVMAPLLVTITNAPSGANWPVDVRFNASSGFPISSVTARYAGKDVGTWLPPTTAPKPTIVQNALIRITEPLEGKGPITLIAQDARRPGESPGKEIIVSNKKGFRFWKRIPYFSPGGMTQRDGLVYIANEYNGEVVVVNPSNNFQVVRVFSAGINTPTLLALSGINNELMTGNLVEAYRLTIFGEDIGRAQALRYNSLFSLPTLPIYSLTPEGIGETLNGRRSKLYPYSLQQQPFEMDADLSTRMAWITKPGAKALRIGSLDNLNDGKATGVDVPLHYRPADIAHVSGYDTLVIGNHMYLSGDDVVLHLTNTQGVEIGTIDLLKAIPDLAAIKDFVYEPRTKTLIVAFQSTIDENDEDNSGIAVFQMTDL